MSLASSLQCSSTPSLEFLVFHGCSWGEFGMVSLESIQINCFWHLPKIGHLCRAQGKPLRTAQSWFHQRLSLLAVLMAIGTFSGGFFTIAIAVHTFGALVQQKRQSIVICRSTICVGWGLSFLTGLIFFFLVIMPLTLFCYSRHPVRYLSFRRACVWTRWFCLRNSLHFP